LPINSAIILLKSPPLATKVTVTTMRRSDVVVVVQSAAHSGRHCLLADVEMKKSGKFRCFRESTRGFLEETNANHPLMEVKLLLA